MRRNILILFLAIVFFPGLLNAAVNDSIENRIDGKITYKSGNVVKVQYADDIVLPENGTIGEMSKKFDTEIFGGKATGWISIGKMKITSVKANVVTYEILEELTIITENGVKKEQFEIGKEVKFIWLSSVDQAE